jgi:hypothetical protein
MRQNLIIGCSRIYFRDPLDIKTSLPECVNCRTRKVLVGEEPHAGSSGNTFSLCSISLAYAKHART